MIRVICVIRVSDLIRVICVIRVSDLIRVICVSRVLKFDQRDLRDPRLKLIRAIRVSV